MVTQRQPCQQFHAWPEHQFICIRATYESYRIAITKSTLPRLGLLWFFASNNFSKSSKWWSLVVPDWSQSTQQYFHAPRGTSTRGTYVPLPIQSWCYRLQVTHQLFTNSHILNAFDFQSIHNRKVNNNEITYNTWCLKSAPTRVSYTSVSSSWILTWSNSKLFNEWKLWWRLPKSGSHAHALHLIFMIFFDLRLVTSLKSSYTNNDSTR